MIASLMLGTVTFSSDFAQAQLVPDNTLGGENSIVTPQQLRDVIEGGAIRGELIFHSFEEFNVNSGQNVYFANPDGVNNIFTRVTGVNISSILGTLGVDGGANLFLLNPKGIYFGENAQLDISGSFFATTSESFIFSNGEVFSTTEVEVPLLTINITPGLQTGKINPNSTITNQGNLAVGNTENLTLLGGIVNHGGTIVAPGGTVEISGVNVQLTGTVDTSSSEGNVGTFLVDPQNIIIAENEDISGAAISQSLLTTDVILQADNDITVNDNITSFSNNNLTLQAGRSVNINENRVITLNGGSFNTIFNDENALAADRNPGVASFTMNPLAAIITNGGDVNIISGTFDITSEINFAEGAIITGNSDGVGGNITISALGDVTTGFLVTGFLEDPNLVLVVSDFVPIPTLPGTTQAGDVNVISLNNSIFSTNFVLANALETAGNITFEAANNLTIEAPGEVTRIGNISAVGLTPGQLTFVSGETLLINDVRILNRLGGDGKGNGINIIGSNIIIDNSSITTLTRNESQEVDLGFIQNGEGGDILIQATEEILLLNTIVNATADFGTADAGNITINTSRLNVVETAETFFPIAGSFGIFTSADNNSTGNGGNININAEESIEIVGNELGAAPPIIDAETLLNFLFPLENTILSTSTAGGGKSGEITINTGNLTVRDGAVISTFAIVGEGNDLTVNATEILLQGQATISTGTLDQNAGNLTVNANKITINDGASLGTSTFGIGHAGNFNLSVQELNINNGALVSTFTTGQGNSGTLTINDAQKIVVTGTSTDGTFPSSIRADSLSTGNAAKLEITTASLMVTQGGEISTGTVEGGAGADLEINTRTLQLNNGRINASTTTEGRGGNITIRASESVEIIGSGFTILQENFLNSAFAGTLSFDNFTQGIVTVTTGSGNAGNVLIETPNFSTNNGGLIATTTLGQGAGGNINLEVTNTINLDNSLLGTGTFTDAESGDIFLNSRELIAIGGAQAFTTTFSSGRAGDINVNVTESINLIDPSEQGFTSGLFASSAQTASGQGGDITVITGEFNLLDRAAVSVSGEGLGNAGDINITADSLFLDNSFIAASSISGQGGNINLLVSDTLVLRNNSIISTRAGTFDSGGGNGGNININAGFVVAVPVENSDINANAFAGNGGNINIFTQGLFGITFREEATNFSDITASSEFGLDGNVNIEVLETNPANSLEELPADLTDAASQIVAGCPSDSEAKFVVTGRGGLPDNPLQELSQEIILPAFETSLLDSEDSNPSSNNISLENKIDSPIIEAQGWIINARGNVELVAQTDLVSNTRKTDCTNLP